MLKICRLCLQRSIPLKIISQKIFKRLSNLSSIQFAAEDNLPKLICSRCYNLINKFTRFRYQIEISHKWLWRNAIEPKLKQSSPAPVLDEEEISTFREDIFQCDKEKSDFMIDCDQLDLSEYLDINTDKNDNESLNFEEYLCEEKQTNTSSLTCQECNKTFSRLSSLKIHQKKHLMQPSHICEKCGKGFYDKASLDRHEQMHLESRRFPCEFCEKSFSRNSERQRHMRYHLNLKRFKCEKCDKSFFESGHLKKHEMIHLNLKPFPCSSCYKEFSTKSKLARHMAASRCKIVNDKFPPEHKEVDYMIFDSNETPNTIETLKSIVDAKSYVLIEQAEEAASSNVKIIELCSETDVLPIYLTIDDHNNDQLNVT